MRQYIGSLLLGVGGALLVVGLALAIGDLTLDGYISAGFTYGALLGFLAFFFAGIGLSFILESKPST
ncbi:MAG: hypothetical protein ACFFBR_03860 [Promethearchaeota archaeon]